MLLAGFLLPLLGLAATAYVLGRLATRRLAFSGRLERGAVSLAVGLALAAYLLLLLGFAGLLRPAPVLLLAAGIHAAGWSAWRELGSDLREIKAPWWIWPALLVGLAPLVVLALYPPTAFDATVYHLPFARAFAETGGVPYLADRRFPVFPQANEILFAAVMLFGRDVAAQGVQLLMALLTAVLLAVWGRETFQRPAGWLAAAVFLGNPIVAYFAGTAYIEPGLTLFAAASLFALHRWRETAGRGWLALCAVFGATAADVKYLGLYFLGVAALTVLVAGGRSRSTLARLRDCAIFGAVALVFLLPWYLRIYVHTGNPIFPYLPQVFGASAWQSLSRPELQDGLPVRLARWVRLPWDVIFARARYNQQPPFSPVYLVALPLLAFGALRDGRVRRLLGIAAVYAWIFTWLPADSRYLLPVLPLVSLAVAGSAMIAARHRLARPVAAWLCAACLLPGWLYAVYRTEQQGPVPMAPAARETYLSRRLPLYPALAWLNWKRGSGYSLYAFHAENLVYFADGRFLGDWNGPASFDRVLAGTRDAATLHRKLRGLGATHLLVPARLDWHLPFPDAELQRGFQLVYRDANARLYALRPPASAALGASRTAVMNSRR